MIDDYQQALAQSETKAFPAPPAALSTVPPQFAELPRYVLDRPISSSKSGLVLRDMRLAFADTFVGEAMIQVIGDKTRPRFCRLENVWIEGNPLLFQQKQIAPHGILSRYTLDFSAIGCLISDVGGDGVHYDSVFNARLIASTMMACGQANPAQFAAQRLCSRFATGKEGTNCVVMSDCLWEASPRLLVEENADVVIAHGKWHGPRGTTSSYAIELLNCGGPHFYRGTVGWLRWGNLILPSGTTKPQIDAHLVQAR